MTKRNFWLQGILLTAFSLFFRITNIGYRAWLSGKIGPEGMGLYQLIFSVFTLTITLSTSGISLAVTRMVTAAIAAGRRETVRSVVTKCFLFCLTLSCTISFLLLTFSDFAAGVILGRMDAAPSLPGNVDHAGREIHSPALHPLPCQNPAQHTGSAG